MNNGTAAVALHVPGLVSLPDHLGLIDPAPAHRHCTVGRLDPAGLVADRCRGGRPKLPSGTRLYCLAPPGGGAVSLGRGGLISFVSRRPPPRFGGLRPLLTPPR